MLALQTLAAFILPVLFIALGLPLAAGRVGPNAIYGFRTRRTLSDRAAWDRVNRVGGAAIVVAGAVSLGVVAVIWTMWDAPPVDRMTVCLLVPVVLVLAAIATAVYRTRASRDG